jgi:hypothetical protein
MKTLKTLGTLVSLTLIALSTGCGKAPELPTISTITPVVVTDSEVVDSYDKDHLDAACAALKVWAPTEKTIKVANGVVGALSTSIFTFGNSKITQESVSGGVNTVNYSTVFTLQNKPAGGPITTACTLTVTNGKLTAVN